PPVNRDLGLRRISRSLPASEQRPLHRHNLLALMLAEESSADAQAIDEHAANFALSRLRGQKLSHSGRLPEFLAAVQARTLILYGDKDVTAWPGIAERLAICRKALPAMREALIAGAGH